MLFQSLASWACIKGKRKLKVCMLAIATSLNARKGHLTPQGGLIGVKASHELLDQNLSADLLKQVRTAAGSVQGVEVAAATGREHGSDVLVELSITVDPQLNFQEWVGQAILPASVPSITEAGKRCSKMLRDWLGLLTEA